MSFLSDVGNSLASAWWMFFDVFWALVLGFVLSGAVQAFVSRAAMQRSLGDHRPRTVAKASFFGMVSSSCSYAASALAKTLFVRGADFTAAQAFMFASTNLVLELGVLLWLLIGWQFAVGEFVGGAIMIALLTLLLPRVVSRTDVASARERLTTGSSVGGHEGHGEVVEPVLPWRERMRTRAGWSDAAGYTVSDLTMVRRELVLGFVVAGFAMVMVPTSVWQAVFVTGHGFWSSLENVIVGPFIAIISCVCSVGNVPLAAALWQGGISFGGVMAFIFADLLALPLLLIYRKYYGTPLMLRLLAIFWVTMSTAGLVTEYLFLWLGWLPTARPESIATGHLGWNYTTVLNVVALAGLAVIYWLYRTRAVGARFAKDPICGMQVEVVQAAATRVRAGETYYFCSDHCAHRFSAHQGPETAPAPAELPFAQ